MALTALARLQKPVYRQKPVCKRGLAYKTRLNREFIMPAVASKKNRAAVATLMLDLDDYWSSTFIELELNDLNYSDLFFQMWLRRDQALTKTGLYDFMPGISRRTAVKYVQELIDRSLLQEDCAEDDKRVKYVSLSKKISARLERYLDFSYERLNRIS
jgi:hypothetical protein